MVHQSKTENANPTNFKVWISEVYEAIFPPPPPPGKIVPAPTWGLRPRDSIWRSISSSVCAWGKATGDWLGRGKRAEATDDSVPCSRASRHQSLHYTFSMLWTFDKTHTLYTHGMPYTFWGPSPTPIPTAEPPQQQIHTQIQKHTKKGWKECFLIRQEIINKNCFVIMCSAKESENGSLCEYYRE